MISTLKLLAFFLLHVPHSAIARGAKCSMPAILGTSTNVWANRTLHATSSYRAEVEKAVAAIEDEKLKNQAAKVADVGTFLWINSPEDIATIPSVADEVPCDGILGLVLNYLPYKDDVLGNASSEYDPETEVAYKYAFVEPLSKLLESYPNTAFAVIVEPFAFPYYFNASTPPPPFSSPSSGSEAEIVRSYLTNTPVALQALNTENVVTYLDIGHVYSLDWAQHRNQTADAIAEIYERAGRPRRLRGFASNVANWNAWDLSPGEFARGDDSRDLRLANEKALTKILSPPLRSRSVPSHFILDTSRNGYQGLRYSWDEWCNVDGAALGRRPGAADPRKEGDDILDAFVWVKRPGESDGASSVVGEDGKVDKDGNGDGKGCTAPSAMRPAPERFAWFQEAFEMLVANARPPF